MTAASGYSGLNRRICYANTHNLYIRLGGRPAAFNILIGAWVDMSITQTEEMCNFSHRLSAHYVGRIFREASIIFSSSCKRTTRSQPRYAPRWQSPNRHGVHVFVDETNRYAHLTKLHVAVIGVVRGIGYTAMLSSPIPVGPRSWPQILLLMRNQYLTKWPRRLENVLLVQALVHCQGSRRCHGLLL